MRRSVLILVCAVAALHGLGAQQTGDDDRAREAAAAQLTATRHAPLPSDLSQYWFVQDVPGASPERAGRILPSSRDSPKALARLPTRTSRRDCRSLNGLDLSTTPLAGYARYYTGVALAGLSRVRRSGRRVHDDAGQRLATGISKRRFPLERRKSRWRDRMPARAEAILRRLVAEDLSVPEDALLALAQVEETLDHREHALEMYRRIYYDSPLSQQAVDAQGGIERLQSSSVISSDLVARAQRRAQRLFDARRWAQARAGFEAIAKAVDGDTRDLVALRIAECDYYLDRNRAARDGAEAVSEGFDRWRPRRATSISARFESWAIGRPTSLLRASSSPIFRLANGPPRR